MEEESKFTKAVSRFASHDSGNRFIVNDDGTIEFGEKSYDVSAINDYIRMLSAREEETAKRYFSLGKREGYYKARKEQNPPLFGDFAFRGEDGNYMVMVREDVVELCQIKDGNMHVLQAISKSDAFNNPAQAAR